MLRTKESKIGVKKILFISRNFKVKIEIQHVNNNKTIRRKNNNIEGLEYVNAIESHKFNFSVVKMMRFVVSTTHK